MPGWQALHNELEPKGLTVVTVALDAGGPDAAREFIAKANATHPSLIDETHITDELFGFVNVPNAVWIDEDGVLVRPSHPAHHTVSPLRDMEVPEGLGRVGEMLTEVKKVKTDPVGYLAALRDWVDNGAASEFALSPDEVVARSRPRDAQRAEAAAAFELAQHLHRSGEREAAVRWFRRAHELDPGNWTYKRQAWTFETTEPGQPSDLMQGPTDAYEGSWLDDVKAIGAEHYYEPWDK